MVRTALSAAEVDEVGRRWRSGQAVKVLSREMRRNPSTVRDLLKRSGGIRPVPRRRWELRLSLVEREEISRCLAAGEALRTIAARLGRAPSQPDRTRCTTDLPDQVATSIIAQPLQRFANGRRDWMVLCCGRTVVRS